MGHRPESVDRPGRTLFSWIDAGGDRIMQDHRAGAHERAVGYVDMVPDAGVEADKAVVADRHMPRDARVRRQPAVAPDP